MLCNLMRNLGSQCAQNALLCDIERFMTKTWKHGMVKATRD